MQRLNQFGLSVRLSLALELSLFFAMKAMVETPGEYDRAVKFLTLLLYCKWLSVIFHLQNSHILIYTVIHISSKDRNRNLDCK